MDNRQVNGYGEVSFEGTTVTANSIAIQNKTIEWGQKINVEDPSNNEECEGFLGWYTESECINKFENCLNLIEISLPSALSNIEDKAFKGCVSLSSITVTNDLSDS